MAELFDIVVRRQIYIEGLKDAKATEFAARLAQLRTKLAQRLAGFEFSDLGDATKTAIRKLIVDLRAIAKSVFDPFLTALIDWLQRFVGVDLGILSAAYSLAVPDKADDVQDAPNGPDMWAMAIGLPMAATGTLALPFLTALLPSLYVKLERTVMSNWANRASRDELAKAIVGSGNSRMDAGIFRLLNLQAAAATNTVMQHLANQTNYALAAKLVGFYEWVSVLDDRTTKICRNRDGNRYVFGKGPLPPAHVNCRSTIVPVRLNDPKTPESFGAWIRGQPDDFVADALAGKRGTIYDRATPLSLNDYAGKLELITGH